MMLAAGVLILAGCSRLALIEPAATATPPASETLPPPSATPSPLPSLTATRQVPATSPATTKPAAPTLTPTPFPITLESPPSETSEPPFPLAEIQILDPGPLSKVTSPFRVHAFLEPGARGRVRVELFGEDGRLLVRQLLFSAALPNRKVNLFTEVEYEIAAVAETARLTLSVEDAFNRTTRLASQEVILLSSGAPDLNPPGDLLAPLMIEAPEPETQIEGGELLVTGLARPASDQPLLIELINAQGKVLGSRQAAIASGPPGEHRPFAASVPYQVEAATRVLLVVRERGGRIPGTVQLTSFEVILRP